MIHFKLDSPPASATASAVAHQYRRAYDVRHPPVGKAVLKARPFQHAEVDEVGECAQLQGLGSTYEPFQLDRTVGQQIVHVGGEQQQAEQVGLAGVGQLTEPEVVQQIVGQLDLRAGALELTEVAKAEKLLHDGLSLAGLDEVDLHDRNGRFAVGFEVDSAELRNR